MHSGIPEPMNPDTQVLNLTRTEVTSLESHVFMSSNLTNLQRLYIINSRLAHVDNQVRMQCEADT